ncbi:MAG: SDR family NAD(P)-dependent oxidoreductase [Zavarzinia sp.]|nr:SDR family NAD(P)-dependent oxidoreductase [Zavarzinia sp.]
MTRPLEGRLALITGASRGIGWAVARAYAAAGADLILLARTSGALEELDDTIQADGGKPSTLVPLDLADVAGIDRLGGAIHERWGKLDILVSNAGVLGMLAPLGHIKPKDWDSLMAVNITANWRLIRSLDTLLRASDAGRAIFVTSGAADKGEAYWGGYATSKAALNALVRAYAAETVTTNLRVNLLSPGPISTGMRAKAFPGEDRETLAKPVDVAPLFVELARKEETRHGQIVRYSRA